MLTYRGKIITTQDRGLLLRDEDADNVVANNIPWSTIFGETLPLGVPLNFVRNDDGSEINIETQCVEANDVPADTVFLFVLEPAFYTTQ